MNRLRNYVYTPTKTIISFHQPDSLTNQIPRYGIRCSGEPIRKYPLENARNVHVFFSPSHLPGCPSRHRNLHVCLCARWKLPHHVISDLFICYLRCQEKRKRIMAAASATMVLLVFPTATLWTIVSWGTVITLTNRAVTFGPVGISTR